MAIVECNTVKLTQGDTDSITITLYDSDNELLDLSNVSEVIFAAKLSADGADAFRLTLTDGEIVKNDSQSTITLNFTVSKTSSVTPDTYIPYVKLMESSTEKQYHIDYMKLEEDGVNWSFIEILTAPITDTF